MHPNSILVIGSSNTDMVIKSPRLPLPGETILGGRFFLNAGGKGANQAVAAARLGGKVVLVAKLGADIFGKQAIQSFKKEGIDTHAILKDKELPSGVALITVDDHGENCIVVASGANGALSPQNIKKQKRLIETASILLLQLETPVETILAAATIAASNKIPVVLNPAPACPLPDQLLEKISVITPNEHETEILTGITVTDIRSVTEAANFLHAKGIGTVIITMGPRGAFLSQQNEGRMIGSPPVKAIDTTAAGDVFNGALVVAIARGERMEEAVRFACRAASLSVTRLGAQASAPYEHEVPFIQPATSIDAG